MTDESEILEGLRKRLLVERLHQMAIAGLLPITTEDLSNAATEFETFEKRGGFYDMARALLVSGWELEGCILLLATWNIARFKFFASNFDIEALRKALADLSGDFASLKECTIQDIDLQANGPCVESMFNRLAEIKGVKFTGAPRANAFEGPGAICALGRLHTGRQRQEVLFRPTVRPLAKMVPARIRKKRRRICALPVGRSESSPRLAVPRGAKDTCEKH